jgi:hypothetical protein
VDVVDGFQGGGAEPEVGRRLLLAGAGGGALEQDGGVAALDEAVVEVEPQEPRGEAGVSLRTASRTKLRTTASALGQLRL